MNAQHVIVRGPAERLPWWAGALKPYAREFTPIFAKTEDPFDPGSVQASVAVLCDVEQPDEAQSIAQRVGAFDPYLPVIAAPTSLPNNPLLSSWTTAILSPHGGDERRFEKAARQFCETFQVISGDRIRQISRPLLVVDLEGRVTEANKAAQERFPDAIGQFYRTAVEGVYGVGDTIPPGHPAREAMERGGKSVARYHMISGYGQDRVVFLRCSPVYDESARVSGVAVLVEEIVQWDTIYCLRQRLHRVKSLDGLHEAIVETAQSVDGLRYKRVRLKELTTPVATSGVPGRDVRVLTGRASVGFRDPANERKYRRNFQILESEDEWAFGAIDQELPLLFVFDPDRPTGLHRASQLCYCPRKLHQEDLEKDGVDRWIDVPLLTPIPQPGGGVDYNPWGVLTVDNGADSGTLDSDDVTKVGLYAALAAEAIGRRLRRAAYRRILRKCDNIFGSAVRQVAREADRSKSESVGPRELSPLLPTVLGILVKRFRQLTGAEVAYFREFRGDRLLLDKLRIDWRGKQPPEFHVPHEIRREDGFSGALLEMVGPDGTWNESRHPSLFVKNDITTSAAQSLAREGKWTSDESRALGSPSAAYIAIDVGGKLRGAIIALERRVNAFADATMARAYLERFRRFAAAWYQIAEELDRQAWLVRTISSGVKHLELLEAAAITAAEEPFFAGLAALLTAGDGLRWNRILIFSCEESSEPKAQLTYAIGGLGDKVEHAPRQRAAWDNFGNKLRELITLRINDPVPASHPEHGDVDPLYDMCVARPRTTGYPIRLCYGRRVTGDVESCGHGKASLPRGVILAPGLGDLLAALSRDQALPAVKIAPQAEPWTLALQEYCSRSFLSDNAYVFPVRKRLGSDSTLVAFVLTDMAYMPAGATKEVIEATRLILDRAADLLLARSSSALLTQIIDRLSVTQVNLPVSQRSDGGAPLSQLRARITPAVEALCKVCEGLGESDLHMLIPALQHVLAALQEGDFGLLNDLLRGSPALTAQPAAPGTLRELRSGRIVYPLRRPTEICYVDSQLSIKGLEKYVKAAGGTFEEAAGNLARAVHVTFLKLSQTRPIFRSEQDEECWQALVSVIDMKEHERSRTLTVPYAIGQIVAIGDDGVRTIEWRAGDQDGCRDHVGLEEVPDELASLGCGQWFMAIVTRRLDSDALVKIVHARPIDPPVYTEAERRKVWNNKGGPGRS